MAFGFKCTNCGHQETNHIYGDIDEPQKIRGYKYSLTTCPGYKSPDKKVEKKLWSEGRDSAQY